MPENIITGWFLKKFNMMKIFFGGVILIIFLVSPIIIVPNSISTSGTILSHCNFIQEAKVDAVEIENPLGSTTFHGFIEKIIDFIFNVALAIAPIMIIVSGFYFVTAEGEPAKIETAKQIILWTLVGLLIIFLAKGLIKFLAQIFGINTP